MKEIIQSRRKFLKFLLIGSGVLVLGKIIGLKWLFSDHSEDKKIAHLGNFKIVSSKNYLNFFNKKGEKIFILHEDGTLEV